MDKQEYKLYKRAYRFASFIVFYNIIEGILSVVIGYQDESLTLFGFGVDSFIEVASNLGVIYMIQRIQKNPDNSRTPFEKRALYITGYGFYLLSLGLIVGIFDNLFYPNKPESTFGGTIIALFSIGIMLYVASSQIKTGKALRSAPIVADAKCTLVCVYMSVVLLLSSLVYTFTGFGYIDAIGAAGLIYFSVREGKEAFDKANGKECNDCC